MTDDVFFFFFFLARILPVAWGWVYSVAMRKGGKVSHPRGNFFSRLEY